MKVYIFPWVNGDEHVVRAMTDEGEAVVQSVVLAPPQLEATVEHVRTHVHAQLPNAKLVWVDAPLDHPLLRSLISPPVEEGESSPEPVVINHLCDTCIHARVCNASAATNALQASIGICPEHNAPEEP